MYKTGSSIDIHRLVPGKGIILGGIIVPCDYQATAHSDGDVVLHALTEAILGALGLGDLGEHFPDSDPKYKGIASSYFVNVALDLLKEHHFRLVNVDCMICLESPKLGAYKAEIRQNVAKLLKLEAEQVNIKAGTFEKVGPIGHHEAVLALCSVLIENS